MVDLCISLWTMFKAVIDAHTDISFHSSQSSGYIQP